MQDEEISVRECGRVFLAISILSFGLSFVWLLPCYLVMGVIFFLVDFGEIDVGGLVSSFAGILGVFTAFCIMIRRSFVRKKAD